MVRPAETSLYLPVKAFLERRGFEIKGEIRGCDLVGLKGDDPIHVVVGELKLGFSLELVLQAVERTAVADEVWLAVRLKPRGRENDARVRRLCRLLGVGLLGVFDSGGVELLVEPTPWQPRRNPKARSRLVEEHKRRRGDPSRGGSTRVPIMTAYRQQALGCAAALEGGALRLKDVRAQFPDAGKILPRDVYGWFQRVERGHYALTSVGQAALVAYRETEDGNVAVG